jgi:dTDP-4-dehydrorhamnose reductase
MKILITGGKGMLGKTLQRELAEHDLVIADLPEVDILQAAAFNQLVGDSRPEAVIHCAAMTQVDRCEQEPESAYRLNAAGSANVAMACQRHNVRLLAISTDYVFRGDLDRPYHEFDCPNPKTAYGKSKYAGEEQVRTLCPNHLIARIAWLYGEKGPSFVHTMLALADGARPELTVVNDQIGNPTSTTAVARHLKLLLKHPELGGTFHLTCEGEATWFDFAQEIFRLANIKQAVKPCTTKDFPRPAPRPANSRLDNMRLRLHGLPPMPHWQDALQDFLNNNASSAPARPNP